VIDETAVPRLAPGVRLQQDHVRGGWVLQAPEQVLLADEIATEVVRLVDGARSVGAMVDDLAARFAAPRAEIAADVQDLLGQLAEQGLVLVR
jgi:pyrroloquinoline quinone biosynthesis protein D